MTLRRLIEILGHHRDPATDPTGEESRRLALELADVCHVVAEREGAKPTEANVAHAILRGLSLPPPADDPEDA